MIWKLLHNMRWVLLAITLIVIVLCLPYAKELRTDPSNQAVFTKDEAYKQNILFQETFGSDDTVVIGLGDTLILTESVLRWIELLTKELLKQDSILTVQSITNVPRIDREILKVTSENIAKQYLEGAETLEAYTRKLRDSSELSDHLLNRNGDFTILIASLKNNLSSNNRKEAIDLITKWVSNFPPPTGQVYYSGTAVEQARFIEKIQRDHDLFVPITFILIMMTLFFLSGSLGALLYPAIVIVTSLITTQTCMVFLGVSLNMMTALVAPVILIVAVGDVVHLQSHTRHVGLGSHASQTLRSTFLSLGAPCLLTSLTTVVGFLSLSLNHIPAVQQFGCFAALGTALAFFWTFFLAPFFLGTSMNRTSDRFHKKWMEISFMLSYFAVKYRKLSLVMGILVLVIGAVGSSRIRVETDILESFKQEDVFRQDTEKIHEALGGVYPLELVISAPSSDAFSNTDALQKMVTVQEIIRKFSGVSHVKYVTDVFSIIDRGVRSKDHSPGVVAPEKYLDRYLIELAEQDTDQMKAIASPGYHLTRMSVFMTVSSTAAVMALVEEIHEKVADLLPQGWDYFIAGQTYLLARMSQNLVVDEVKSILIAMGVICLLLIIWMRSLKIGLMSLFVNMIPMAFVFGMMPLLSIQLNTATAMIGAVAVGLIVDNSIHVLFRFRESEKKSAVNEKMVKHVMNYCAQPLISAALVLVIGFSVTLMGSIRPTIEFGILMMMMIFSALIANLFILPALLLSGKKRKKNAAV